MQPEPLRALSQRRELGLARSGQPQRDDGEQRARRRRTGTRIGRSDSDRSLRVGLHLRPEPALRLGRPDGRDQRIGYGLCLRGDQREPAGAPEIIHRTRISRYRTPQPDSVSVPRPRAQRVGVAVPIDARYGGGDRPRRSWRKSSSRGSTAGSISISVPCSFCYRRRPSRTPRRRS